MLVVPFGEQLIYVGIILVIWFFISQGLDHFAELRRINEQNLARKKLEENRQKLQRELEEKRHTIGGSNALLQKEVQSSSITTISKKQVFYPLICPQCGGAIEAKDAQSKIFCKCCGTEFIFKG